MVVRALILVGALSCYHWFDVPDDLISQARGLPNNNMVKGDRLTDGTIDVIGTARFVLAERGGSVIGVEHLLLAMLRTNADMIRRFISADWSIDRLKESVEKLVPSGPVIPDETEAPLSGSANEALLRAVAQADSRGAVSVGPLHLFLGLLGDESNQVVALLRKAGITLEVVSANLR